MTRARAGDIPRSLDIVIVNWNAGAALASCIRSIAGAVTPGVRLGRITIVDNASGDGSAEGLEPLSPQLDLVRNAENLGFGAGCNMGAARGNGEFLLFLNPDMRLFTHSLAAPLERLAGDSALGIVGIALVDASGVTHRSCSRFPRLSHHLGKAFGLDRLRLLQSQFMTEWDHASTREVDHVMGAFFLMRRRLFEELGGFDDRFFLYAEDLDFSLRARQRGYRTLFLAEASAYHEGGGTSKQVKARRLYLSLRSRLLYSAKHDSLAAARIVWLATMLVEPVTRLAAAVVAGKWNECREISGAYALLRRDPVPFPRR